ncbi:MAG: hypothetical protein J0L92_30870 [Deltaproteobacteria bacterium]|nr:hypothetical protein [Deltaproteobacteria bacterium]
MSKTSLTARRDAPIWLARAVSVAVSIMLALPIWRGGWLLQGDHAPHIAEAIDLATHASGWSDLAYGGFPLGVLHSPLWYGLLALVVRLGVPAWIAYCLAVTMTEIALGLVALEVGRRRAPVPLALGIAVLVQTQSLLVTGPSGVLTGMWTFGLAIALFLVLVDRLHEPFDAKIGAQIAALVGGIGLTHTFAIHAVVALVAVRCVSLFVLGREERRAIAGIALASMLGAVASAAYWVAATLSIDTHDIQPVVSLGWPNFQIFFRPWLEDTFDPLTVLRYRTPEFPDLLLLFIAALSFLRLSRFDARQRAIFATTVGTMVLVLFVVAHIATMRDRHVFGPIPWRIMVVTRSLLLFVALASLPRLRLEGPRVLAATAIVGALCLWWGAERGRVLAIEAGSSEDPTYHEVHGVFREVARLSPEIHGRVYVQNTHGIAAPPLGSGHPLALLPARAGVRAVGSYYSLVPFPTDMWLTSFVGPVVGQNVSDLSRSVIDERLDDLGAEVVVLVDPTAANVMRRWSGYTLLGTVGRFSILRRPRPGLARSDDAHAQITRAELGDGRFELEVHGTDREHDVMLAIAYAQRWALESAPEGAYLARRRNGLMRLHLPPGDHHVVVGYHAPRWPLAVSIGGWIAIALWALFAWRSRVHAIAERA